MIRTCKNERKERKLREKLKGKENLKEINKVFWLIGCKEDRKVPSGSQEKSTGVNIWCQVKNIDAKWKCIYNIGREKYSLRQKLDKSFFYSLIALSFIYYSSSKIYLFVKRKKSWIQLIGAQMTRFLLSFSLQRLIGKSMKSVIKWGKNGKRRVKASN